MKKLSNTEAEKSVAYKKSVYIGGKYKINRVPEIAQDFKVGVVVVVHHGWPTR